MLYAVMLYGVMLRRGDGTRALYPEVFFDMESANIYRLSVLRMRDEAGDYRHLDLLIVVRLIESA